MNDDNGFRARQDADRARLDWLAWRFAGARLTELEAATATELRGRLRALDRLVARERNKGLARHWAYDLNRHIALKQARDMVSRLLTDRSGAVKASGERFASKPGARTPTTSAAGEAPRSGARPPQAIARRGGGARGVRTPS